jgi:hypothetical protein
MTTTTDLDKLLMMMTHTTEEAWSVNSFGFESFVPSFLSSLELQRSLSLWFVVITRSFLPSIAAIREASKALIWIQIKEPWKWCSCSKKCVRKLINPNLKSSLPQAISRKKNTRGLIYDHQLHDLILEISLKSYTDRKCEERDLQERERAWEICKIS